MRTWNRRSASGEVRSRCSPRSTSSTPRAATRGPARSVAQRHHDLAAVRRDRHHPGRPVDRGAVVVAVAQLGLAGVQRPCARATDRRAPTLGARARAARRSPRVDRVGRGGERGVHPVAGGLHHVAVVRLDRRTQDLVVAGERGLHRVGVLLPEAGRALDVGEEEGDRPGRQVSHGGLPRRRRQRGRGQRDREGEGRVEVHCGAAGTEVGDRLGIEDSARSGAIRSSGPIPSPV